MLEKAKSIIHTIEPGLRKYQAIMDSFHKVDVSKDQEFQRLFNGFYRIRQRPKVFYESYYSYMESCKNKSVSFRDILYFFYLEMDRMEASFSSKLLATINPSMPVWDEFVLKNLNLKKPRPYSKTRFEDTVNLYGRIVEWYEGKTISSEGEQLIQLFDETYPNENITDVKKIDFILWKNRD